MNDYSVDPGALNDDARVWLHWADELGSIREVLPWAIDQSVFGTVAGVDRVCTTFNDGLATLRAYIETGEAEFEGIATALRKAASTYADNDAELHVDAMMLGRRVGLL